MAELDFRLLLSKEIYAILDGDTVFDEYESRNERKIRIALPYLSGPDLCEISTRFGKPATYTWGGGNLSRWEYVQGVLKHCISNGNCSSLLTYLLRKSQFQEAFKGLELDEIEECYTRSVREAIKGINKHLLFSGAQLVYRNKKFSIIPAKNKLPSDDEMLDNVFEEEKPDLFASVREYERCESLGRGGFGEVYRYHNDVLDMDFAVKIYSPYFMNDEEREEGEKRFFREARMLFSMNHHNIVRIYDAGRIDGDPFIRMELIKGEDLQTFRDRTGNLKPENALKAIRQALNGLSEAHRHHVIHRDLKPTNIMVEKGQKLNRCVIIDFGISAFMETEGYTRLTKTGESIAGGQYIDPRLLDNPKLRDPRSDIYSAGAILYFLLCGRAPVGSDIDDYLRKTNKGVTDEILSLLHRSLSYDIENRYTSCDEFIMAINRILGEDV